MLDARKLYPMEDNETFFGFYNYTPLIEAIGTPAIRIDDGDYQGETRILYDNDGHYGYLCIGWGSCSCCDALQACADYQDLQELIDSIESSVRWFDSRENAIEFFRQHDWEGDACYDKYEQQQFIRESLKYLGAI